MANENDESRYGESERAHAEDAKAIGITEETYRLLRRIAADYLRRERIGHTLQPTALVNEAYLRLGGEDSSRWRDRGHFVATTARAMRHILVDHARARNAEKRGGGEPAHARTLVDVAGEVGDEAIDLLALDEAVRRLESLHERQARIVELRFFGGLTVSEAAAMLDVSDRTVELDWRVARAWLRRELRALGREGTGHG